MCVTFVVFTDCKSRTRPISTNPGFMEAAEYGLTRGTCFLACRLELDAVAGLLWISWCVLGGADFSVFFFSFSFFFERTGLLQVGGHLASFTSLLVRVRTRFVLFCPPAPCKLGRMIAYDHVPRSIVFFACMIPS